MKISIKELGLICAKLAKSSRAYSLAKPIAIAELENFFASIMAMPALQEIKMTIDSSNAAMREADKEAANTAGFFSGLFSELKATAKRFYHSGLKNKALNKFIELCEQPLNVAQQIDLFFILSNLSEELSSRQRAWHYVLNGFSNPYIGVDALIKQMHESEVYKQFFVKLCELPLSQQQQQTVLIRLVNVKEENLPEILGSIKWELNKKFLLPGDAISAPDSFPNIQPTLPQSEALEIKLETKADDQVEHDAAIKVQKIYRGFFTRKLLIDELSTHQKIALKNGHKYSTIKDLNSAQLNGLLAGLTRAQVKHERYTQQIADLVDQGFKFDDLIHADIGELIARRQYFI